MFKTVLFPIDQSRNSQDAMIKVAELVKYCQSQLVLLTVSAQDTENPSKNAVPEQAVKELLSLASQQFSELGITVETVHRTGQPAFCICDVADELNADLIMMGCRGIGLSTEHQDESVSNRVINLSPCPVMVIP